MTLKEKLKEYFSIFCLRKTSILTYETLFKRSNFLEVLVYFQNNKYTLNCLRKTSILTYETLFKRSNFLKVLVYFQNNKYTLNCIIIQKVEFS